MAWLSAEIKLNELNASVFTAEHKHEAETQQLSLLGVFLMSTTYRPISFFPCPTTD